MADTVEDFLTRTKGAAAGDALGDFLQRTKGVTPLPKTQETTEPAPTVTPGSVSPWAATIDRLKSLIPNAPEAPTGAPPSARSLSDVVSSPEAGAADIPQSQTPNPALGRIGAAAGQAYRDTPPILTPEAQAYLDQGPLGRLVYNPLLHILGGVPATFNALAAGVGQAAAETSGSPALGRDVYMGAQILPAAGMGAGVPRAPEAPPLRLPPLEAPPPVTLEALTQAVRNADNPLAAAVPKEGGLRSVGAASRDQSAGPLPQQTPGQAQANLMKDVQQTAPDRAGPQGVDHTVYVPGVERPLAAREFSPQNSVKEKTFTDTDQEFAGKLKAIEKNNNEVMTDYYHAPDGVGAGDAVALERLEEARDAITPPQRRVFNNEQPVDAAAVVQQIDDILASPAGKRTAVTSVLKQVRDSLFDKDGNLETLPSQLYGVRQGITDRLRTKAMTDEASNAKLAKSELQNVIDTLDPVIAQGAPGFTDYLKDYAAASQPITAMRFLQNYEAGAGKLTDAHGNLQFNRVQKMLETVAQQRGRPGIQPAKALSDDQVQALVNLRNELGALSYKDQLARVKGSDTVQKASTLSRIAASPLVQAAAVPAEMAAHYLMAAPTMGIGNVLLAGGKIGMRYRAAAQAKNAATAEQALKARLLDTTPPAETP